MGLGVSHAQETPQVAPNKYWFFAEIGPCWIYQAINYFLALPNNTDIAKYKILPRLWDILKDVKFVLSISHK